MCSFEERKNSRLQEFCLDALDFQAALLTLECLKKYWEVPELQSRYPQNVLMEARDLQCSYLAQYADELSRGAAFLKSLYAGRS